MVRWVALVVLASGCGRLGFDGVDPGDAITSDSSPADARVCTAVGHDEDTDGIDDACDVCPHLPDAAQPDADGDGVGDACDPEPANGRQRIELFDPLTQLGANGWMMQSQVASGTDEIVIAMPNGSGTYFRAHVPDRDTFVIGGFTGNANLAQQHLVALLMERSTGPGAYYCEIYDGGADSNLFFTLTTDGATFDHPASAPVPRFANQQGMLRYEIDSTTVRCATTWGLTTERATTPVVRPAIDTDLLTIYAENVELHVQYFLHIRTL